MTTLAKTVLINGVEYARPFDRLLRPLTTDERAGLLESGRRLGFQQPVLVCTCPGHGEWLIDGVNRAELAAAHGLPLMVRHLGELTAEQAEELARRVNADRRHLTPDEQRAARAARIERVTESRAAGKSLRTIAGEEGVSTGQVQRDLRDAAASGVSPGTPDAVAGRDGKWYPATRPPSPHSGSEQISSAQQDTSGPADTDDGRPVEAAENSSAPPGYEPGDEPTPAGSGRRIESSRRPRSGRGDDERPGCPARG